MPYCTGCRPSNRRCAWLKGVCRLLLSGKVKYCYECPDFPCDRLRHIDRRYMTNFRMSMLENLEYVKTKGAARFLLKEAEKWRCSECGGVINCHNGICYNCGLNRLEHRIRNKANRYRWE